GDASTSFRRWSRCFHAANATARRTTSKPSSLSLYSFRTLTLSSHLLRRPALGFVRRPSMCFLGWRLRPAPFQIELHRAAKVRPPLRPLLEGDARRLRQLRD